MLISYLFDTREISLKKILCCTIMSIKFCIYQVRVPSGAWIEILISSSVPQILTVFINPSVHDWMNSRGLCGFISHSCPDDFMKPDGTKAAIPGVDHSCSAPRIDSAEEFIQSWMYVLNTTMITLIQ